MTKIRALVVEDSLSVRKHLVEILAADPEVEVVGEAGDGLRALELCERLRPDVMTLDMMMPGLNGLGVTEQVMAYFPTPILIVSSSFNRGELFKTYDALAAGAVDVHEKPSGEEFEGSWERAFLAKIKLVARIKVITHPRARLNGPRSETRKPVEASLETAGPYSLVVLGASTGGPTAILEVLRSLPPDFPIPMLLVLHISRPFGENFAGWLDTCTPIPVRCARDREPLPRPGLPILLIAPPEHHLLVEGGRLRLDDGPERHSCRPSVDVLFESAAAAMGSATIACLLTGMGMDGAMGFARLRQAGAMTIAQDEASSVVFGMPREAIRLGAARRVLPLVEIGPTLSALADPLRTMGRRA